jgi:N-acyl-D-amino-acid deacylase
MAEFLQIAKTGNVVAQLSHFNVRFDTNAPENAWERAVGMLVAEKDKGLDVAADTTPFRFGLGGMSAILPEWLLKDGYANVALALKESTVRDRLKSDCDRYWRYIHKGQWSRVRLQGSLHYPEFTGMSFPEIAKEMKQDEWDCYFDILMAAGPDMDKVIMFGENMTEAHLAEMISHPDFSLGVDGFTSVDHGALADATQSQFPYCGHIEFLAHHVREKKTLTLESAIHKMSSKPAQRFALKTRGEIKEGWFADMVIFDADKVRSDSTLENPCVYPVGIQQVIVNGTIVVDESQHTLKRPGRVLRRK